MGDDHPGAANAARTARLVWRVPRAVGAAGLCLVLLLCPFPVGFQDQMWWAFACAAAVVSCGLYLIGAAARPRSGAGIAVPAVLCGLILLVAAQLLPLPASWVAVISPRRAELAAETAEALGMASPASVALSASTKETRDALLLLVACTVVFFSSAVAFKRSRSLRGFYAALAVLGAVMSAWGFVLLFGEGVTARLRSTYTNPNRLAMLLGLCMLCGIGWRLLAERAGRTRERTVATVMSVLCGAAFAATLSRMAIAGMSVTLLVLAFLALRRREREEHAHDPRARRLLVVGASIAISAVLASILASFDPVWNRYSILFDSELSGNGRAVCWAMSMGIVRDFPAFGSGAGSFQHVFPLYQKGGELAGWWKYAHNEYVNALADVGVAGLAVVVAALVLWYRAAAKGLGRTSSTARVASWLGIGAVTFVALHSLADYPLKQPANALVFAALAGATLGAVGVPSRARMGLRAQSVAVILCVAAVLLVPVYFGLAGSAAKEAVAKDAAEPVAAAEAYAEALAFDPRDIELRQDAAKALVRAAGDGEEATRRGASERALAILLGGPAGEMIDARGLYLAGVLEWETGRPDSADRAMRGASILAPAYPSITRAVGTYFIRRLIETKGEHPDALDDAVRALGTANASEVSAGSLKSSFDLLERVAGGPDRLSEITPHERWAVTLLAQHHSRAGRYERARDVLEEYARRLDGDLDGATQLLLAELRDRCGDVEGATEARIAAVRAAPEVSRSSVAARVVIGLWNERKHAEASIFVRAMKRRFGGECAALRAEGEFAFRSKDYVKAYGLLKENADRSGDPYDHYRLAEVALKLRRDVEAERHLTLAIAADPTKYHYWSLRAAIRQKAGDVPLAIQDLQAALDAAPGNTQVRSRLSALLSQTQRVDELVQLWRNAERDRPQDPAVLEALARALFAAGDFEPAVECARRSYEIAPTRTSIRAFLRERDPDGPIAGDSER